MNIDSAPVRRQIGQTQAFQVVTTEFVQEVCNFFGKVTYLRVLAKSHLAGADQILPPQSPPSYIGLTTSSTCMDQVHPLAQLLQYYVLNTT